MFSSQGTFNAVACTLMAYFVLSRNGERSLNKFLSPVLDPDPDHLRGGPSHGHNTSCVKNQVNRSDSFGATRPGSNTHRQAVALLLGRKGNNSVFNNDLMQGDGAR